MAGQAVGDQVLDLQFPPRQQALRLGDRNWYLPSWLEWLPEINIEGVATPETDHEPVSAEPEQTLDQV